MSARMFILFLAVLYILIFAVHAAAENIYSSSDSQGNKVRLFESSCETTPAWLRLKQAEMTYRGKIYKACWAIVAGAVVIFDEAGDISAVPMQAFKKEQAI